MKNLSIHIFLIILASVVIAVILGINNGGYISDNVDWIGFVGAITGGILTLYGVWWTIKDNENQRRKDLAIQYRPLLICKKYEYSDNKIENHFDSMYTKLYLNYKNEILKINSQEIKIRLEISNLGRGEALLLDIASTLKTIPSSDNSLKDKICNNSLNDNNTFVIPVQQSIYIDLIFCFDKTQQIPKKMLFISVVSYRSMFDENILQTGISLIINTTQEKSGNNINVSIEMFKPEYKLE